MPVSSASPRPTPSSPNAASETRPPDSDSASGRLSEAELEALRQRDPEAVRRHIYGNRGFLRSVLRRFTETEETARDLLQETFFQALRSLPNFRGESKLSTWLYSVAKNVALARYRDDKRRSPLEEETLTRVAAHRDGRPASPSGEAASWDPVEETTRNEERSLVHGALEELSANYRQVIKLRDLEELSTEEAAERLGLTRVNVRVRLHRARKKLKDVLSERIDPDYQHA
jgi:RNA polymerase sigma-70 factor (ECF subfamily)